MSKPNASGSSKFIPLLLRQTPRWCRWKLQKDRQGNLTKRPDCSTKDPDARREFSQVAGPVGRKEGFGFITGGRVETPRGFLIALDYDNCRNPKTGYVSPWASDAVMRAFHGSFAEVSPSGYGLRQWLLVDRLPSKRIRSVIPIEEDPIPGCAKSVEVQVFGLNEHGGGYVTVTGDWCEGTHQEVLRVKNVDAIFDHFNYSMDAGGSKELASLPTGEGEVPEQDEIKLRVLLQPHGEDLVNGEWEKTEHRSASEAYFELGQRVLVAAHGHGEATVDFLLDRTAWGHGDIENSKDPGKYERIDWVTDETLRMCGKTHVTGTADAFDTIDEEEAEHAITASLIAAQEAISSERTKRARSSPIAQIRAPAFADSMHPPEPREYLLSHPDGVGLLPRGKVGLLSAAGGTGKTTALVQLAVAVATRRRWFGHFHIGENCGARVLFLMGEEDAEEVQRKLWHALNAMGLSAVEHAAVAKRVECVPLAGYALPFLSGRENGEIKSTEHADALRQRLADGDDWGLVIVDPISRFCGVNVEGDNILATRFISELETFAKAPGLPTVLGVGHTSKAARASGSAEQRGVTGLIDAVRWGASMLTRDDGRVVFEIQKNNLAPPTLDPLMLVRGAEGHLVAEDENQRRIREQERQSQAASADLERAARTTMARDNRIEDRVMAVVAAVGKHPGKTGNELVSLVSGRRTDVLDAIRRAEAADSIVAQSIGRRREFFPVSLLD